MKELYLKKQANKEKRRLEEEAREFKEAEMNENWKKYMLEQEIEKHQII